MAQGTYTDKIKALWESMAGEEGKRWARPEEPILHALADEKEEPHLFYHNTNYRISRKYINIEKVKVSIMLSSSARLREKPGTDRILALQILKQEALECMRSSGTARVHKCQEVGFYLCMSLHALVQCHKQC